MSLGAPPAIAARRPGTGIACSSAVCACSASRQGPSAHAKQNIGVCCGALKCGPSPPSRPGGASRACAWCVCGASAPCCGPAGRAGRGLRTASTALCRSRRIVAQNPYTAGHSTLVSLTSAESAAAFMEGPTGGGGPRGGGGTPRRRWRARARVPGGPQLAKFVGVLQELRDAGEMLHTQTEAALCERLEPWAAVRAAGRGPRRLRLRPGGAVHSARDAGSGLLLCGCSPGGEPPAGGAGCWTTRRPESAPPAMLKLQMPSAPVARAGKVGGGAGGAAGGRPRGGRRARGAPGAPRAPRRRRRRALCRVGPPRGRQRAGAGGRRGASHGRRQRALLPHTRCDAPLRCSDCQACLR